MDTLENRIAKLSEALSGFDGELVEALQKASPKMKVESSGAELYHEVDKAKTAEIEAAWRMAMTPGVGSRHIRLYGPTGSGKTTLAMFMARKHGLHIERVACTPFMGQDELLGSLAQDVETGKWVPQWKALVTAAISGYPIILDEFNKLSPDALEILLPFLDDLPEVTISVSGAKITIKKDPGFFGIVTSNDRGDGASTSFGMSQRVNSAVLNRFGSTIFIGYLPKAQELSVLQHRAPGVPKDILQGMLSVAEKSRTAAAAAEGWQPISTRDLIGWATHVRLAMEADDGRMTIAGLGQLAFIEGASYEYRDALLKAVTDQFGVAKPPVTPP